MTKTYIFTFITSLLFFVVMDANAQSTMQTSGKQAVVIDMGTGMTLLAKDADKKMPTSSMSKVMTAYMVFDALKDGQITMNTMFPVSEKAWKKGGSKMFVEVGKKVAVEDLLKGVIVQSGNDATIVLAEGISGDEEAFATAMTVKAQNDLGMKNSQFKNASGWPDPDHYSTANDLVILAQKMIVDFPHYYSFYSIKEFTFAGIKQPNRNPLLYRNIGVDGIKTGHTEAGGYGLMASGEKDGRRVVMVVNGLESAEDRATESARLMSWALNSFDNVDLVKKDMVLAEAETVFGAKDMVQLTVPRNVRVSVPKLQREDVKTEAKFKSPVQAPIAKGDVIGELLVSVPQVGDFAVPLIAAEDVAQAGLIGRSIDKFKYLFSGE
jgi:D-alanyl-D-alanine carboxypeptidase (penicillin-binding protein 5/6)